MFSNNKLPTGGRLPGWVNFYAANGSLSERRVHGAEAGLAQQLGGDEGDQALAPLGLLHQQQAAVAADDVVDRLLPAGAEPRSRVGHAGAEELQGTGGWNVMEGDREWTDPG